MNFITQTMSAVVVVMQSSLLAPPTSTEEAGIPFEIPGRSLSCHLVTKDGAQITVSFAIPTMKKGTAHWVRGRLAVQSSDPRFRGEKMIGLATMPNEQVVKYEIHLVSEGTDVSTGVEMSVLANGDVRAELLENFSSAGRRETVGLGLCQSELIS